jgi:transporter family-2 protein
MDRGLAFTMTAAAGGLLALQAPINSHLGKTIGTWQAVLVSFVTGTIVMVAIVSFASGGFGKIAEFRTIPWYYVTGGILGAAYVTAALIGVRTIGAAGLAACTIAGQLSLSVIVDRFGWFGVQQASLTWDKVVGIAFLLLGAFLIIRHR